MDYEAIMNASREGNAEQVQSLLQGAIRQSVEKEVAGLKGKNDELLGKLAELKPLKELGAPDEVRQRLSRLEELEREVEANQLGTSREKAEKLAEEWATKKFEAHRANWEETVNKTRSELESATTRAQELERRLHQTSIRQAILREAADVWPDLQGEVVSRLAPIFRVEGEDPVTGDPLLIAFDPESETVIPGSGYRGSLSPGEALAMLKESKGNKPWNSRGRAFFKSYATGTGTKTGGPGSGRPSAEMVGQMSQKEYEKRRAAGEI